MFVMACVFGVIKLDKIYGKDVLIAGREGAANCTEIFKLKDSQLFFFESFCFGRSWSKGRYVVAGDTIFLKGTKDASNEYLFAVIENESKTLPGRGLLWLYRNKEDKEPTFLIISKNELFSLKK